MTACGQEGLGIVCARPTHSRGVNQQHRHHLRACLNCSLSKWLVRRGRQGTSERGNKLRGEKAWKTDAKQSATPLEELVLNQE